MIFFNPLNFFNRSDKESKKAFTLIELLVVIAIIGLLATLSVLALNNARAKARDAKRVADVRQMQTALELYFNSAGRYPTAEEFNSGSLTFYSAAVGTTTYMLEVPAAPTPADGVCSTSDNEYTYTPASDGSDYSLTFCIANSASDLPDGNLIAFSGGVIGGASGGDVTPPPTCSCSDVAMECCSSCVAGDVCGGGSIAVAGSDPLIVSPGGCTDTSGTGCDLSGTDSLYLAWDNPSLAYNKFNLWELLIPAAQAILGGCPSCVLTGATDSSDGRVNVETIKSLNGGVIADRFVAVKFCDDLSVNGFSDWYLPAQSELVSSFQASALCDYNGGTCTITDPESRIDGFINPLTYYWTSAEADFQLAYFISASVSPVSEIKNFTHVLRCVR